MTNGPCFFPCYLFQCNEQHRAFSKLDCTNDTNYTNKITYLLYNVSKELYQNCSEMALLKLNTFQAEPRKRKEKVARKNAFGFFKKKRQLCVGVLRQKQVSIIQGVAGLGHWERTERLVIWRVFCKMCFPEDEY